MQLPLTVVKVWDSRCALQLLCTSGTRWELLGSCPVIWHVAGLAVWPECISTVLSGFDVARFTFI